MNGANCPPACTGTLIRGAPTADNPIGGIDFRHPSFGATAIDPDLKPMRQQEATAGLEHQLNDVMALSVRYVHKQIDRAIEDTGFLDCRRQRKLRHRQPGRGLTQLAFTDPAVALPKAKRDYDSVEFAVEKRLAKSWYLRSSYLWSRLYGNYPGLSQSDENGRTSPNVGRLFDYPLMMFQDGGVPAYGPLPTDRPHQFKTQFIYQFRFGTIAGSEPVRGERSAGDARNRHLPAEQLHHSVPGPRQRWPDAGVLADRLGRTACVQVHGRREACSSA